MPEYGKSGMAHLTWCKRADYYDVVPVHPGSAEWIEQTWLLHQGWKRSRRGLWYCPKCAEKFRIGSQKS